MIRGLTLVLLLSLSSILLGFSLGKADTSSDFGTSTRYLPDFSIALQSCSSHLKHAWESHQVFLYPPKQSNDLIRRYKADIKTNIALTVRSLEASLRYRMRVASPMTRHFLEISFSKTIGGARIQSSLRSKNLRLHAAHQPLAPTCSHPFEL
jgi:hypothetical protein